MDTAPKDGTPIRAMIPAYGDNLIAWFHGLEDSSGAECGGWQWMESGEPPNSWTDGICWDVNEDGVASVQPIAWKPL